MSDKVITSVGGFYERPDGVIVKTCGFSDSGATVQAYEYHQPFEDIPISKTVGWKPRNDIKEFPGCDNKDKRLPYDFDLYFDIKSYGELVAMVQGPMYCDNPQKLKKLMERHNLVVTADGLVTEPGPSYEI